MPHRTGDQQLFELDETSNSAKALRLLAVAIGDYESMSLTIAGLEGQGVNLIAMHQPSTPLPESRLAYVRWGTAKTWAEFMDNPK